MRLVSELSFSGTFYRGYSGTSVAEPVHFWPAPAPSIFFTGSGSNSYKKEGFQVQLLKFFKKHSFFLTGKISFIYKYLFFKQPFINVGTNEENINEKLACFI